MFYETSFVSHLLLSSEMINETTLEKEVQFSS